MPNSADEVIVVSRIVKDPKKTKEVVKAVFLPREKLSLNVTVSNLHSPCALIAPNIQLYTNKCICVAVATLLAFPAVLCISELTVSIQPRLKRLNCAVEN